MVALPPLDELHSDIFWCLQFTGERIAALRHVINETGTTGFLERRLEEEAKRAERLADFAVTLFRLVPKEAQLRDLMGQLAERGYFRAVQIT